MATYECMLNIQGETNAHHESFNVTNSMFCNQSPKHSIGHQALITRRIIFSSNIDYKCSHESKVVSHLMRLCPIKYRCFTLGVYTDIYERIYASCDHCNERPSFGCNLPSNGYFLLLCRSCIHSIWSYIIVRKKLMASVKLFTETTFKHRWRQIVNYFSMCTHLFYVHESDLSVPSAKLKIHKRNCIIPP